MPKLSIRVFFRRLLIFLPLAFLSACLPQPALHGELHGQLLWQGEVRLWGNIILAEDAVLTIAPGTRIIFLPLDPAADTLREHPFFPGSELIVRGRIIARGTKDQPISFQFVDSSAPAGSWGGINIEGSSRAIFNYCSFRQADSAIHARNSRVVVENSLFTDNLVAIRFHDADIRIENNLLHNNGTAIRFHFGAPLIRKNVIRNNRKGLFITSAPRGYRIENNSFLDNQPYQVTLGEGVREDVVLKNNYWGAQGMAALLPWVYDGRLDDWLGTIEFQPLRSKPDQDAGIHQ
ncbi:MAG: right-handed parallel beta-helix repeat-containing protein [Deltaproteobacteria bacterium]|nr:right-handed parallel beta-helix repeat-containing protein [Deltaproteobacteria bacterium]